MNSTKLIPWNWFRREESGNMTAHTPRRRVFAAHSPLYMELDRLFDSLFNGYYPHGAAPGASKELGEAMIRPNLDISGDDKHYYVTVELPGVDENELSVEVDNDILRISGEKKYEHKEGAADDATVESGKNYYRIERSYGSFQRVLALPEDVDASNIRAAHKNGVLTITLPRKEELVQENRRIQIAKG